MNPLQTMLATVTELRACEARLVELRNQLLENTKALARIEHAEERLQAGLQVYWSVPESNANEIARAVLGRPDVYRLLKLGPPHPLGVDCTTCGKTIEVRSRAEAASFLKSRHEGDALSCSRCLDLNRPATRFERSF